jgi:predicted AAA+ superfamily ATPase
MLLKHVYYGARALLTQRKNAAYVNFEDERLQLKQEDLNAILEAIASLKGEVEFIVFDEIQYVNGWERFISRILPAKKVIITGSNARLMSKEFSTFLTGRHVDFELFPFSFREYLFFNDFSPNV